MTASFKNFTEDDLWKMIQEERNEVSRYKDKAFELAKELGKLKQEISEEGVMRKGKDCEGCRLEKCGVIDLCRMCKRICHDFYKPEPKHEPKPETYPEVEHEFQYELPKGCVLLPKESRMSDEKIIDIPQLGHRTIIEAPAFVDNFEGFLLADPEDGNNYVITDTPCAWVISGVFYDARLDVRNNKAILKGVVWRT